MYRKIIITLDNEIGRNRINNLNYKDFTLFYGVDGNNALDEVKNKMKNKRTNISEKCRLGKLGCFSSYILILKKIIDEKLDNVIILEDDLEQINELPENLGNEICYLNGLVISPNMSEYSTNFEYNLLKTYRLNKGLNKIDYDQFKILGTWGIFIPTWEKAEILLDKITKCKSYTSIDNLIANKKLINYFYYPAIYKHNDNNISNIRNNNKFPNKSNYFSKCLFLKKSKVEPKTNLLKEELVEELEILKNYKIRGNTHRINVSGILTKAHIREHDGKRVSATAKSIKSQNFGLVRNLFRDRKNLVESDNNKKYPEVYESLKSIARKINSDFKYNSITINKNVKALPHRDKNNKSVSMIIGLGDYSGGGLFVENDEGGFDLYDIKYKPLYFNGGERTHYTQDFQGNRYTIIYYFAGLK